MEAPCRSHVRFQCMLELVFEEKYLCKAAKATILKHLS